MLSFLVQIVFSVLQLYNGFTVSPLIVLEAFEYRPSQFTILHTTLQGIVVSLLIQDEYLVPIFRNQTTSFLLSSFLNDCWVTLFSWFPSCFLQPFCRCPSFGFFSSMASLGPCFLFFSCSARKIPLFQEIVPLLWWLAVYITILATCWAATICHSSY